MEFDNYRDSIVGTHDTIGSKLGFYLYEINS